jgi:hypothetical protein
MWIGLAVSLSVALFGLLARAQMIRWGLVFPGPVNVFFRLYAFHEPLPLLLLVAWTVVAAIAMAMRRRPTSDPTRLERLHAPSAREQTEQCDRQADRETDPHDAWCPCCVRSRDDGGAGAVRFGHSRSESW